MIYDTISKGEDGLYHVHAFTDERKRNFIQLDNVTIADTMNDITIDVDASEKIDNIHETNIQNAVDSSEDWFGKKVSEKTIRAAYMRDESLTTELIDQTKVFNFDKEPLTIESLQSGMKCSVIVEFQGLWFAKKAFGPAWNIVQVRLDKPDEPMKEKFDDTYPADYMFGDDQ